MGRYGVLFLILFVYLLSPGNLLAEDPVVFNDENLKAAVEEELWLDDPYPSDMLELIDFRRLDVGISDLTGLEYATNLQTLWIRNNDLSDISPLASCTNIEVLNLSQNVTISDLSPLSNMLLLRDLDCHRNQISDLSFALNLTNLERLVLRWNDVSDLSGLSHLSGLRVLRLEYNEVVDLTPLESLVNLELLDVSGNDIVDLSPLAGMAELRTLYCSNCEIEDVSILPVLESVNSLTLRGNLISDISSLCDLEGLSILYLQSNPLDSEAYSDYLYNILANNPGISLEYDANPQGPGNVTGTADEYGQVLLNWDSVENGPSYTSYYCVYRQGPSDSGITAVSGWQTGTAYEDQVTESGRFDYYVQCAISAAGAGAGDLSDALSLDVALISSLTISSGQDGEVTSPGEGTFNYDEPTEILVCAESSDPALYEFTGWIGTAVTAGNVDDPSSACTTVLVDGHHTLIANFGSLQHDLLVYSSAGGSVTRPGEGTFSYLDSTEVDIKAVAQDDSYSFAGWSGTAVAAGKVVDSNALETSLFVDGDYSLCANFVGIEQCFLDVGFVGDGAAGGGGVFDVGSEVEVWARAANYHRFVGWTATGEITIADANSTNTTVVLAGNGTLTAHFEVDSSGTRIVSIQSGGGGYVRSPGEGSFEFPYGYELTAYVEAMPGYYFSGWFGSVNTADNPLVVTVRSDLELIATFSSSYNTVEIDSTAGGRVVEPNGTSDFERGKIINITAEVEDANLFVFDHWSGTAVDAGWVIDPCKISTKLIVKEPCTLKAVFTSLLPLIHVDNGDSYNVALGLNRSSHVLENGTENYPFDSIQEAIDVAGEFATVRVAPGTYVETLDFAGKNIHVLGFDPNSVGLMPWPVIDANQEGTVVTFTHGEDPNCLLAGFILTGGHDGHAGAVLCDGASPRIQHCVIAGNQCDPNEIEAMDEDWRSAILYCEDSNSCFMHCTVADNLSNESGYVGCFINCMELKIVNSIIYRNDSYLLDVLGGPPWFISYSNLEMQWPGLGNMNINPLFADGILGSEGDYHLKSEFGRWNSVTGQWETDGVSSPCLSGANPNAWTSIEAYEIMGPLNYGAYGGTLGASLSEDD